MKMPPIGFGCSPMRGGGRRIDLEPAVREALEVGYRLFDTAELYGNESAVGRALRSPVAPARDELFIIGKVWRTNYRADALRAACEASLTRLGIDAFDLYLLHVPGAWRHIAALDDAERIGWDELERRAVPRDERGDVMTDDVSPGETWQAMQALVEAGLASAVGVSNFNAEQIAELGDPLPAANQIACAPRQLDESTAEWCRDRGIALIGHSPLSSPLPDAGVLERIAAATARTPEQIVLRWCMQRGFTTLTSSSDSIHLRENFAALDFALDRDQMKALES